MFFIFLTLNILLANLIQNILDKFKLLKFSEYIFMIENLKNEQYQSVSLQG